MLEIFVLCVAGFATGALNAVAGGGTFISFPALVWLGVPPIMANATATLTAIPGYAGSAWAFRKDIAAEGALSLPVMLLISALGGLTGALLLTVTNEEVFMGLVPWLLLVATLIFAAGPKLLALLKGVGLVRLALWLLSWPFRFMAGILTVVSGSCFWRCLASWDLPICTG